MAQQCKLFETRTICLPIPVWQQLEADFGPMKSRRAVGQGYRGLQSVVAALVNYFGLPRAEERAVICEATAGWLRPRFRAMKDHFARTQDQAAAEAAARAGGSYRGGGHLTRMAEDSPLELLFGVLDCMSKEDRTRLAERFIRQAQRECSYIYPWFPEGSGKARPGGARPDETPEGPYRLDAAP